MTTVTRKDLERQVMALQGLAMECAKARTVEVSVRYLGKYDRVEVEAESLQSFDGGIERTIPLREWCASPVILSEALASLKAAHRDIIAMHMQALDTLDSEHTEVEA